MFLSPLDFCALSHALSCTTLRLRLAPLNNARAAPCALSTPSHQPLLSALLKRRRFCRAHTSPFLLRRRRAYQASTATPIIISEDSQRYRKRSVMLFSRLKKLIPIIKSWYSSYIYRRSRKQE